MRYAFLNDNGIVVNSILGELNEQQRAAFLNDYFVLFGATQIIEVDDDTVAIYSGGSYTNGEFQPPPQPEIIDGTATLMPTEQPIEPQEQV